MVAQEPEAAAINTKIRVDFMFVITVNVFMGILYL
jgi:hypothetical protein